MGMKDKGPAKRQRLRDEADAERVSDASLEQRVRKWKRWTLCLGIALTTCIMAIIPFLHGNPFHVWWNLVGRNILLLSMGLLLAFWYAAVTTYVLWSYLRAMRRMQKHSALPTMSSSDPEG